MSTNLWSSCFCKRRKAGANHRTLEVACELRADGGSNIAKSDRRRSLRRFEKKAAKTAQRRRGTAMSAKSGANSNVEHDAKSLSTDVVADGTDTGSASCPDIAGTSIGSRVAGGRQARLALGHHGGSRRVAQLGRRLGDINTYFSRVALSSHEPDDNAYFFPPPLWYHGYISRGKAEATLAAAPVSSYLVRNALDVNSTSGVSLSHLYSLSIRVPEDVRRAKNFVKHYRILEHKPGGCFELENGMVNRPRFPTVEQLVAFFQTCALSRKDGLLLKFPCPSDPTIDDGMCAQPSQKPVNFQRKAPVIDGRECDTSSQGSHKCVEDEEQPTPNDCPRSSQSKVLLSTETIQAPGQLRGYEGSHVNLEQASFASAVATQERLCGKVATVFV